MCVTDRDRSKRNGISAGTGRGLHFFDKEIALLRARDEGALLTTSESILFELTVTAEHEQFKQISKLVK